LINNICLTIYHLTINNLSHNLPSHFSFITWQGNQKHWNENEQWDLRNWWWNDGWIFNLIFWSYLSHLISYIFFDISYLFFDNLIKSHNLPSHHLIHHLSSLIKLIISGNKIGKIHNLLDGIWDDDNMVDCETDIIDWLMMVDCEKIKSSTINLIISHLSLTRYNIYS